MIRLPATLLFFSLTVAMLPGFAWSASGPDNPLLRKVVFGILLHDRGPTSDRHERGVDPNWEMLFAQPAWRYWRWIGSPAPMVGMTPNFTGDTSVWYGGLAYEFSPSNKLTDSLTNNLTKKLFLSGASARRCTTARCTKIKSAAARIATAASVIACYRA